MRLSQFIYCFLDGNYNNLVADSFHNTAIDVLSKEMNFTKKEIKNYIEKEKEKLKKERELENNTNNSANANLDYVKIVEYLSSKIKNDNSIENIKREMKNVREKFGYVNSMDKRPEVKGKKDFHTLVVSSEAANHNCKEINKIDTPKPLKLESINEKPK
jgi:site-specific recombinase XerD